MAKNYNVMQIGSLKKDLQEKGRVTAGEELGLTGSEISFNYTPKGKFTPFVHYHQLNEEVYIILCGKGKFMADGDEFPIEEGTVVRVSPKIDRAIAAGDEDLAYICIQTQAESLKQSTNNDGVVTETKASWMKG